jgi:hypothetical protein
MPVCEPGRRPKPTVPKLWCSNANNVRNDSLFANTSAALMVLGWDGFGLAPQTWAVIMLVAATVLAGVVGRWVNDDNIYRGDFVYAFIGIIIQQRDVPAIVWTAAGGVLVITIMIATTWRRRARQFASAT